MKFAARKLIEEGKFDMNKTTFMNMHKSSFKVCASIVKMLSSGNITTKFSTGLTQVGSVVLHIC